MPGNTRASVQERIDRLSAHLKEENPELLGIVQSFRKLDKVAYKLRLLDPAESYATQVSWWPVIAVLGTFSSGKSTFINHILERRLQPTGNQAVDDKFTVICYGRDATPRVLPGLALDNDPRFPFYRISGALDEVLHGDGQRLDSYLQLKTTDSERLRGKILIDSPGFDADEQRTATLRITNHIIDLSDLVLVFFDARHPEPGAMRDTLAYLVEGTLQRPDFNKFLYVLNQIDNAAREDNPEEVFAAWQRALAQKGLTAGRFYQIYDPDAAAPIEDERLRQRFEAKREHDLAEIVDRMRQLEVERSYRVAGKLERTATRIRDVIVPRVAAARRAWRRRVLWLDAVALLIVAALLVLITAALGLWDGLRLDLPWPADPTAARIALGAVIAGVLVVAWLLHRWMRKLAGRAVVKAIRHDATLGEHAEEVAIAFERNVRSWWPFVFARPKGWTRSIRRRLDTVLDEAHRAIQRMNDVYTDPSGRSAPGRPASGDESTLAAAREPATEPAPVVEPDTGELDRTERAAGWRASRLVHRQAAGPSPHRGAD